LEGNVGGFARVVVWFREKKTFFTTKKKGKPSAFFYRLRKQGFKLFGANVATSVRP
jgi:hypothetical protein